MQKRFELFKLKEEYPNDFLCFFYSKRDAIRSAKKALINRSDVFAGDTIVIREVISKQIYKIKLKGVQ